MVIFRFCRTPSEMIRLPIRRNVVRLNADYGSASLLARLALIAAVAELRRRPIYEAIDARGQMPILDCMLYLLAYAHFIDHR